MTTQVLHHIALMEAVFATLIVSVLTRSSLLILVWFHLHGALMLAAQNMLTENCVNIVPPLHDARRQAMGSDLPDRDTFSG